MSKIFLKKLTFEKGAWLIFQNEELSNSIDPETYLKQKYSGMRLDAIRQKKDYKDAIIKKFMEVNKINEAQMKTV